MTRQRSSIDILEEAVNLLRSSPLETAVTYLIGAVPLTLAFLFFLADMNRSPYAFEHLPWASLALALLYVWKNSWQAIFMAKLYHQVSPSESGSSPLQGVLMQATLQPLGLLIPLPFPWVTAFFRNVALYSALGRADAISTARRQAVSATRQNWGVLLIVALGSLLLFANVVVTIVALPQLARSFLGIEGDLARLGAGIVNLTTLGVAAAITWLAIDPLLDAVYTLRCFYGESVATGADLRAGLKRLTGNFPSVRMLTHGGSPVPPIGEPRPSGSGQTWKLPVVIALFMITAAHAQTIDEKQLDHAIDHVVHQREFTWRAPRAIIGPEGKWVSWYRSAVKMVEDLWDLVWRKLRAWLRPDEREGGNGQDAAVNRRAMLALITVIVALIAAGLIVFILRRKRSVVVAAQAVTALAPVNLADESLSADRLPESEWLKLAEEWMEKGDFRLALRAMYLASLNYLSSRDLVSLRRWKSGLDYRRELARRARSKPDLPAAFSRSVEIFEQGWYGRHAVDRAMAEDFAKGLQEMRAHAK